ncbi:MAG: hypothetical protein VKK42_09845 [Lyngbya sp.]|nr:hypothetical protein [Lyngbya sp.]
MQEIIDQLIASERFSIKALYESVWSIFSSNEVIIDSINLLRNQFSQSQYKKLGYGILRHAFLIELVKIPGIDSTKFRTRWYSQLRGDPRECSFEECLEIAQNLVLNLTHSWLSDPENLEVLNLFLNSSIIPYELPIDYLERPKIDDTVTQIHRKGNLAWIVDENVIRTVKLRQYLINSKTSPDAKFFKKVLDDKIKVKTYLTDRVLTGIHKTNREKRWETHPRSVHFALRRVCIAIEYELITQLCAFDGFPEHFRKMLQDQEILPVEMKVSRCPITLEPLSFEEFRDELMNPKHGKSNFQVGHLNPLKFDDPNSLVSGHVPGNISWISADGNRIQGSMSLEDVRNLLVRIAHNYENEGWA